MLLYVLSKLFLVLQRPLFPDVTVNEGQLLAISCITRNIPDITTFQILDPNGIQIPTVLGVYRVPNVTRAFSGSYTCCVMSTIDNSTVSAISRVVVQCKFVHKQYAQFMINNQIITRQKINVDVIHVRNV